MSVRRKSSKPAVNPAGPAPMMTALFFISLPRCRIDAYGCHLHVLDKLKSTIFSSYSTLPKCRIFAGLFYVSKI